MIGNTKITVGEKDEFEASENLLKSILQFPFGYMKRLW